jgi:hypothetical protein
VGSNREELDVPRGVVLGNAENETSLAPDGDGNDDDDDFDDRPFRISELGKLLTTVRKPAINPLPSIPYRLLISFRTKLNALFTAAWLDMFLPTGLTSPNTVASQKLSLDERNTILTLTENPRLGFRSLTVKARVSESSASII